MRLPSFAVSGAILALIAARSACGVSAPVTHWRGVVVNFSEHSSADELDMTFKRVLAEKQVPKDPHEIDAVKPEMPDESRPGNVSLDELSTSPQELSGVSKTTSPSDPKGLITVTVKQYHTFRFSFPSKSPGSVLHVRYDLPEGGHWALDGISWRNLGSAVADANYDEHPASSDIVDFTEDFLGRSVPIPMPLSVHSEGWHVEGKGLVGAFVKDAQIEVSPLVSPSGSGTVDVSGVHWSQDTLKPTQEGLTAASDRKLTIENGATELLVVRSGRSRLLYWHTKDGKVAAGPRKGSFEG